MSVPSHSLALANHMLVAMPWLADSHFSRSVALVCQHDDNGAMGVVVNQPSEFTLGEVLAQMEIAASDQRLLDVPVLNGGPVHPERGFVIHDDARAWDSCLQVGEGLYLTTSRDILEAMARGDGPRNVLVALGCAGWGSAQLESEVTRSSWLTVPADAAVLFHAPLEQRWQQAASRIGVDLFRMAGYNGHA